jgi:isoaspartyl peptidase/L-asparaginase-like protein (Ntn-hydrolase superfamily)
VIGIDSRGNVGMSFNSARMHRAWVSEDQPMRINTYQE